MFWVLSLADHGTAIEPTSGTSTSAEGPESGPCAATMPTAVSMYVANPNNPDDRVWDTSHYHWGGVENFPSPVPSLLCYAKLQYAKVRCAMLRYVMLKQTKLFSAIRHYTWCYGLLCYTMLSNTVPLQAMEHTGFELDNLTRKREREEGDGESDRQREEGDGVTKRETEREEEEGERDRERQRE